MYQAWAGTEVHMYAAMISGCPSLALRTDWQFHKDTLAFYARLLQRLVDTFDAGAWRAWALALTDTRLDLQEMARMSDETLLLFQISELRSHFHLFNLARVTGFELGAFMDFWNASDIDERAPVLLTVEQLTDVARDWT